MMVLWEFLLCGMSTKRGKCRSQQHTSFFSIPPESEGLFRHHHI